MLRLFPVICLCATLFACGGPSLSPLSPTDTIVTFGDSLTVGKGANPNKAYPRSLSNLTSMKVINAGISGETTAQGLRRLPGILKRDKPSLVILLEGGNDILRNMDLTQTRANLAEMIGLIKASGAEVALVGVPLKSLFSSECADFYEELAKQFKVPLECEALGKLLRDNVYKSDAVHLNEAGYAKLAESVAQLLRSSGAL